MEENKNNVLDEKTNKIGKVTIIVVGVIFTIIFLVVGIYYINKYNEAQKAIKEAQQSIYAINPTEEQTTETNNTTTSDITTVVETENTTETTVVELPEYTFNVGEDANADRTDIDWTNISIDGKMVTFPCTYSVLQQTFGTFYTTDTVGKVDKEVIPSEIGLVTKYTVKVTPTTGTGLIYFTFTADEPTELTNCLCTGVSVSSMSTSNAPLITTTLRGGIHFGSTAEEILDPNAYEKITESYSNKGGDFEIHYKKLGYEMSFYGINGGLYSFEFDFNAYEPNN
jgi:hypothetical protein